MNNRWYCPKCRLQVPDVFACACPFCHEPKPIMVSAPACDLERLQAIEAAVKTWREESQRAADLESIQVFGHSQLVEMLDAILAGKWPTK